MDPVYKQLALVLDAIPNGYPAADSGVELKILAKLFSPQEAEIACRLTLEPQTVAEVTRPDGVSMGEVKTLLKGMVRKGLIEIQRCDRGLGFKLMPFIVGFYEYQNAQIDEEFAQLFESYYHEVLHRVMNIEPPIQRVLPIEKSIPHNIEVLSYQKASTYIDEAQSWGVLNCICRVQKRLIGEGCHHSIENCLVLSPRANAFKNVDAIRSLTKEETLAILEQADQEGLVHSTSNIQKGVTYICNCCTCSCGVLRGIAEYGHLNAIASSDFVAAVDKDLCTECGLCVDRCQFGAISMEDGSATVDKTYCIGCGLCVTHCPSEALTLKAKSETETAPPPETEEEWRRLRAKSRKEKS